MTQQAARALREALELELAIALIGEPAAAARIQPEWIENWFVGEQIGLLREFSSLATMMDLASLAGAVHHDEDFCRWAKWLCSTPREVRESGADVDAVIATLAMLPFLAPIRRKDRVKASSPVRPWQLQKAG